MSEVNTRQLVQGRINMYEEYRQKIYNGSEGMAIYFYARRNLGCRIVINDMVDFYEELLENL